MRALIETLFMPLQRYLVQILGGLMSVGTASAAGGGGGGLSGLGGLAMGGLGALAGFAGGGALAGAAFMPGGFAGKVAGRNRWRNIGRCGCNQRRIDSGSWFGEFRSISGFHGVGRRIVRICGIIWEWAP